MKTAWITVAVIATPSCGPARSTSGTSKQSDPWEKSSECASQAEKTMAASDRDQLAQGFPAAMHWENHYSPKYDKCFVSAMYFEAGKRPSGESFSFVSTMLTDAFERRSLAMSISSGGPTGLCNIGDATVDCAEAASFISEHMKD